MCDRIAESCQIGLNLTNVPMNLKKKINCSQVEHKDFHHTYLRGNKRRKSDGSTGSSK